MWTWGQVLCPLVDGGQETSLFKLGPESTTVMITKGELNHNDDAR